VLGRVAAVLAGCLLLVGCHGAGGGGAGGGPGGPAPSVPSTVLVTSPAFAADAAIPARFTCAGSGRPPPLAWSGTGGSAAQALVVDDPDAPRGTFVHWVVLDLPGSTTGLPEGGALPAGATQARNSAGGTGWTPPCPPSGTHHYRFTVYVLRARAGLADGAPTADALAAIGRLATARGELVGLVTHG
jgi:Raf kinase inhibitor-like YbhB/YbcL family protein